MIIYTSNEMYFVNAPDCRSIYLPLNTVSLIYILADFIRYSLKITIHTCCYNNKSVVDKVMYIHCDKGQSVLIVAFAHILPCHQLSSYKSFAKLWLVIHENTPFGPVVQRSASESDILVVNKCTLSPWQNLWNHPQRSGPLVQIFVYGLAKPLSPWSDSSVFEYTYTVIVYNFRNLGKLYWNSVPCFSCYTIRVDRLTKKVTISQWQDCLSSK